MLAPDVADRWRPRTLVARVLQGAPARAASGGTRDAASQAAEFPAGGAGDGTFRCPQASRSSGWLCFDRSPRQILFERDYPLLKWSERFSPIIPMVRTATSMRGPHLPQLHAIISAYWV